MQKQYFYKSSSRGEDDEDEEEDVPFVAAANEGDETCLFCNDFSKILVYQ